MDTIKTIRKSVVKGMISLTRSRKDGIVLKIMLLIFFFRTYCYINICSD